MRDHDDLTDRLGALGSAPVPGDIRDGHLHAMRAATVEARAERRRFGRLAVAAAAFVGFAVGSTGFAMAGALPDPAQGVAHDVLSVVQVDVPDRPQNHGFCVSNAARNEALTPQERQAAKAECKETNPPGRSGAAPGQTGDVPGRPPEAGPHPNADLNDCKGKPPWAGQKRGPNADELTARGACPDDELDDAADAAEDAREAEQEAAEAEQERLEEEQSQQAETQKEQTEVPEGDPGS